MPPPDVNQKKAPFASAIQNAFSVLVLASLSIVTFAYKRSLEPLYGSAPTEYNLNKVVWAACILGSFAPTLPLWTAVVSGGALVCAMPYSAYYVAVYTGRMGDPVWGPVATHLSVLAPVLYFGVAIVKALQEAPDHRGIVAEASAQMISLPVCQMAIMSLQELWPIIPFVKAASDSDIMARVGSIALTFWALSSLFQFTSSPSQEAPSAQKKPAHETAKSKKSVASKVPPSTRATQPKSRSTSSSSKGAWRMALVPIIPFLSSLIRSPTLSKPLVQPYTHPTVPLRILSSVRSEYSGTVLVGEIPAFNPERYPGFNFTEPHSVRYLRAGHSLLGGVWIGDRVHRRDQNGPLSVDQDGNALGDSIYGAFVLQEAARLHEGQEKNPAKNALFIGLGAGIASSAFIQHGLSTTVVEIDPVVYEAAKRFFGLASPEPGNLFLQDAREWVNERHQKVQQYAEDSKQIGEVELYDIIIHDCFSGGGVPGHIFTVEFFEELKSILNPAGVVAVNFAGELRSDSARSIITTLKQVFPQCRAFHDFMGELPDEQLQNDFINWVFFCTPSSNPITFRPAAEADFLGSYLREQVLSTFERGELDLGVVADSLSAKDREKYVLTDRKNPLVDWQKKEALRHWKIMRDVLPDVYWETY